MRLSTLTWESDNGWSSPFPSVDSASTLVLVFGDECVEPDVQPLKELAAAFPTSVVVGCSTSGQIMGPTIRDRALVVAIARFDSAQLKKAHTHVSAAADSYDAGVHLAASLAAPDLRAVFVVSDGLNVNGSALVAGLSATVGPGVVITGGLAGDGERFDHTWVFDGDAMETKVVLAVGIYGDSVRIGSGSQGGWSIFGPERIVTRASGNVLYELDDKPALELYKRYLGHLADDLPANALLFPLAVRPDSNGHQLVRTVLAVDETNQSMTFAGDIPQGWRAQLMRSNAEQLVEGASQAATMSATTHHWCQPTLGIAISCVGRRLVLGGRTEEELEAVLEVLPQGSELVGFYSYGEIAPDAGGVADLHNQTMTITTICEALNCDSTSQDR